MTSKPSIFRKDRPPEQLPVLIYPRATTTLWEPDSRVETVEIESVENTCSSNSFLEEYHIAAP